MLSYVRSTGSGRAVVVAMNFTAMPQTLTIHLAGSGVTGATVKTLAADDASLKSITRLKDITLPPYTSWVASVE